jgi:hypothetical protein
MQLHQRKESIGDQDEENAKSIPVFKSGRRLFRYLLSWRSRTGGLPLFGFGCTII